MDPLDTKAAPACPDCPRCGHNTSGVVAYRCTTFVPYPEGDPRGMAGYCDCPCGTVPEIREYFGISGKGAGDGRAGRRGRSVMSAAGPWSGLPAGTRVSYWWQEGSAVTIHDEISRIAEAGIKLRRAIIPGHVVTAEDVLWLNALLEEPPSGWHREFRDEIAEQVTEAIARMTDELGVEIRLTGRPSRGNSADITLPYGYLIRHKNVVWPGGDDLEEKAP